MTNLPHTEPSPKVMSLWDHIARTVGPKRVMFGGSVAQTDEQPHSYHRSWLDIVHDGGYSVHYYGDRHMSRDVQRYACALDVSFHSAEDIRKYTARLHHYAVQHGPLHWSHGLREFAGTLDSMTTFGWDCTRNVRTYGWDSSHLYHIHLSFNRRLILSPRLLKIATIFTD